MISIDEIERDIPNLSETDKSRLLRLFVSDMDGEPDRDVEQALLAEAYRRDAEIENVTVKVQPLDEAIERIRSRIRHS